MSRAVKYAKRARPFREVAPYVGLYDLPLEALAEILGSNMDFITFHEIAIIHKRLSVIDKSQTLWLSFLASIANKCIIFPSVTPNKFDQLIDKIAPYVRYMIVSQLYKVGKGPQYLQNLLALYPHLGFYNLIGYAYLADASSRFRDAPTIHLPPESHLRFVLAPDCQVNFGSHAVCENLDRVECEEISIRLPASADGELLSNTWDFENTTARWVDYGRELHMKVRPYAVVDANSNDDDEETTDAGETVTDVHIDAELIPVANNMNWNTPWDMASWVACLSKVEMVLHPLFHSECPTLYSPNLLGRIRQTMQASGKHDSVFSHKVDSFELRLLTIDELAWIVNGEEYITAARDSFATSIQGLDYLHLQTIDIPRWNCAINCGAVIAIANPKHVVIHFSLEPTNLEYMTNILTWLNLMLLTAGKLMIAAGAPPVHVILTQTISTSDPSSVDVPDNMFDTANEFEYDITEFSKEFATISSRIKLDVTESLADIMEFVAAASKKLSSHDRNQSQEFRETLKSTLKNLRAYLM
jgi:hypothetical protein